MPTRKHAKAVTPPAKKPTAIELLVLQTVDRYEQLRGDFARLEARVEALADSIATINTSGLSAPTKGTTSPLGGAAVAR